MASSTQQDQNGTVTEEQARIQRALEILAKEEAKQAEREAKRQAKQRAKLENGEEPNAAHAMLKVIVRALTAVEAAHGDDPDAYRAYIRLLTGQLDGTSNLPNVTTSTDFKVASQFITATMPKVPVTSE